MAESQLLSATDRQTIADSAPYRSEPIPFEGYQAFTLSNGTPAAIAVTDARGTLIATVDPWQSTTTNLDNPTTALTVSANYALPQAFVPGMAATAYSIRLRGYSYNVSEQTTLLSTALAQGLTVGSVGSITGTVTSNVTNPTSQPVPISVIAYPVTPKNIFLQYNGATTITGLGAWQTITTIPAGTKVYSIVGAFFNNTAQNATGADNYAGYGSLQLVDSVTGDVIYGQIYYVPPNYPAGSYGVNITLDAQNNPIYNSSGNSMLLQASSWTDSLNVALAVNTIP